MVISIKAAASRSKDFARRFFYALFQREEYRLLKPRASLQTSFATKIGGFRLLLALRYEERLPRLVQRILAALR
jgi:hypothetical protein